MAIQDQLPEQAPIDLIFGSRELLRGKVRKAQLLNAGSQSLLVVFLTFTASTNSYGNKVPYCLPWAA